MKGEGRGRSKMPAKVVCVFGSASDVGKSSTATAIGRLYARRGLRVAPYKAQNMSNNAGVVRLSGGAPGSTEMGEIGRAQVIQAKACLVEPETDMNPVLLKPSSDRASQVVLHGKVLGEVAASELWKRGGSSQSPLRAAAHESLRRLVAAYDVVVVEGAGSCGEVNLRDRDFVNFDAAHAAAEAGADVSVLLVCDIEKGGVFAQAVGTLAVLRPSDRALVTALVVNKFRGDPSLFDDGRRWIEKETRLPVLGVVPYFDPLDMKGGSTRCVLDAEDGLHASSRVDPSPLSADPTRLRVAVVLLPRIANLTDFAPLQAHSGAQVDYLRTPRDLHPYTLVIIPGSKSVLHDYEWMEDAGWLPHLRNFAAAALGGPGPARVLLGVCGGYQMLGSAVCDPDGCDSKRRVDEKPTLGLLPGVRTTMRAEKTLRSVTGAVWEAPLLLPRGTVLKGYEIHTGESSRGSGGRSGDLETGAATGYSQQQGGAGDGWFAVVRAEEEEEAAGAGRSGIVGTYLHGIFDGLVVDELVAHMTGRAVESRGKGVSAGGVAATAAAAAAADPAPAGEEVGKDNDCYDVLADHYLGAMSEENRKVLFGMAEPSVTRGSSA